MAASDLGRLETDPLYLGLTRPAMLLGVSYMWFSIEGLAFTILFINTQDFGLAIPGGLGTHLLGYLLYSREPRFLELWLVKAQTCTKCRNTRFHGGAQSYDLYK